MIKDPITGPIPGPTAGSADLFPFACPRCHAAVAVPSTLVGHPAACPVCAAGFITRPLPAAATPAEVEAPAAATALEKPVRKKRSFEFVEPPPKTIGRGGETIELRRLTPEEKAVRRVRRNLVMLALGTALLFSIVLIATRPRKKPAKNR